jgi:hypothetical protein
MFGYLRPKEEYVEKIAFEVVALSKEDVISLTDAVIKKAGDYGLSSNQIENVCARVNHIKFREKFAEDKLSVFNIAKIDDVLGYKEEKVAAEDKVIELTGDTIIISKFAEEAVEENNNVPLVNQDMRQNVELYDMSVDNADQINDLQHSQSVKDNELYETVKSLALKGESLGDIYEVLVKTWGEDNISDINSKFIELINRLKSEGYMDSKEKFEIPSMSAIPEREIDESDLSIKAAELMAITDDLFTAEYVSLEASKMMKQAGMDQECNDINKMYTRSILSDELLEKAAAIPLGAGLGYAEQLSGLINPNIARAATDPSYMLHPKSVGMISGSIKKILPLAIIAGAAHFANKYVENKKYEKVRKDMMADPEFSGVTPSHFDKVYSTIVRVNPDLLETPYALGEIMKKHIEYGTIDVGALKDLNDMRSSSKANSAKTLDTIMKATSLVTNLEG